MAAPLKKIRWISILILAAMLLTACSPAASIMPSTEESKGFEAERNAYGVAPAPMMDMAEAPAAAQAIEPSAPAAGAGSAARRIVLMNADLSIVVDDPSVSMTAITKMAEEMKGFVVSSNLYRTTTSQGIEVPAATITIRIPAERLNESLDRIKALTSDIDTDVLSENISGQDVTSEYTDLQSRLTNLQNAEARLKEIMASATRTEDVLQVYNELTRVTEQIEVIKGQIKYYDEASALSAISVNMQSKEAVQPLTVGGWKPVGVARDAVQALLDALQFIANAAIWATLFCLPIGLLIGLPIFFIVRGIRKWNRGRKSQKAAVIAEPAGDEKENNK